VIDLRAGVTTADGRWTIAAYGRNVTNEYYWTNAYATQDVIVRNAARPVTYGLRVSARFN
jgi:outer membrane receptor protein involved in Fe transport